MTRQKLNSIVMPFNYNYWNLPDVILGSLDLHNATLRKSFTHTTQLSLKSKYKTHSFRCAIIFPWSLSTGCLLSCICLLLEIIVLIAREQQKCSVIETPLNGLYCFVFTHAGSISEVCVFSWYNSHAMGVW